jgi:hypothetical protein
MEVQFIGWKLFDSDFLYSSITTLRHFLDTLYSIHSAYLILVVSNYNMPVKNSPVKNRAENIPPMASTQLRSPLTLKGVYRASNVEEKRLPLHQDLFKSPDIKHKSSIPLLVPSPLKRSLRFEDIRLNGSPARKKVALAVAEDNETATDDCSEESEEAARQALRDRHFQLSQALKSKKTWTTGTTAKLEMILDLLEELGQGQEDTAQHDDTSSQRVKVEATPLPAPQAIRPEDKKIVRHLENVSNTSGRLDPRVPEFRSIKASSELISPVKKEQKQEVAVTEVKVEAEDDSDDDEIRQLFDAHLAADEAKDIKLASPTRTFLTSDRTAPPAAPLSTAAPFTKPKRVICDDHSLPGREAKAHEQWYADKQLAEFMKKYPMTGQKAPSVKAQAKVERNPHEMVMAHGSLAAGRHAAMIQQRLEFLLWRAKEKKAEERMMAVGVPAMYVKSEGGNEW